MALNDWISLNPDTSGLPYDQQAAQIKRQQALADQMRQSADQPIPVNSYQGIQAPISWGSILGNVLKNVGASMKETGALQAQQKMGQQDTDTAKGLLESLTQGQKGTIAGAPALAPINTQVSGTLPQLPGGPAPTAGPTANVALPGQEAQGPQQGYIPLSADQKIAAILAARGGPQTQMIQQTMLPQIMGRENKIWENENLGMSKADTEKQAAETKSAQDLAKFKNELPQTEQEKAELKEKYAALAETHAYHQSQGDRGLDENGLPNPTVLAWQKAVLNGNATMQNVPKEYKNAVAMTLSSAGKDQFGPLAKTRNTLASERITAPYRNLPQYALTAQGLPYLQRINAALKHPGPLGDADILDSLTKLNTAGNAITDAQVRLITDGKSWGDTMKIFAQKAAGGGTLSPEMRQQAKALANEVYKNYRGGYQAVYDRATKQLEDAGVPKQFWTMPDLNEFNQGKAIGEGDAGVVPVGKSSKVTDEADAILKGLKL